MNIYNDINFKINYPELITKYDFNNKSITHNKININCVITHSRCIDGFMSATIVRKWLLEHKVNIENVMFIDAYHGMNNSNLCDKIKNKNVLICDYSFPTRLFNDMIKATKGNILLLDHHKTAEKQLQNINKKYIVFDMEHSGAFITWTFMYGFNNIPKCVLYIEDNDIWNKSLPLTREFTSYAETLPFEYSEYEKLFDDTYISDIVFTQGCGMIKKDILYIEQITKQAIPYFVEINCRYYFIACVGSSGILRSEIGNKMLTHFENTNFSMVYATNISRNYTSISYRSNNDKTDVAEIAQINNGGGHRNASGIGFFGVITKPLGNILDNGKCYNLLQYIYTSDTKYGKIIMVNTQMLHKHITKYLIQKRHSDKKLTHQEGLYCMRNKTKNNFLNEFYIGAVAWYYDGYNNLHIITISIVNDNHILSNIKNNILCIDFMDKKNNIFEFKSRLNPSVLLQQL